MKEYDLFVPLYYNDGRQIEPQKFQGLQKRLLDHFGGLTFFPQPNQGFWTMAGITYRDEIVLYRVISSNAREARRFLSRLKQQPNSPHVAGHLAAVRRGQVGLPKLRSDGQQDPI